MSPFEEGHLLSAKRGKGTTDRPNKGSVATTTVENFGEVLIA